LLRIGPLALFAKRPSDWESTWGHPLALIAMAIFSGLSKGNEDLSDYAATLSQGQLRALELRLDTQTRRVRCPQRASFQGVLTRVNAELLQRVLLLWRELEECAKSTLASGPPPASSKSDSSIARAAPVACARSSSAHPPFPGAYQNEKLRPINAVRKSIRPCER